MVQLLAEQVCEHWDVLFSYIKQALPEHQREHVKESVLLESLTSGKMQCWVILDDDGQIKVIGTTSVVEDKFLGIRNLHVYSVTGVESVSNMEWAQAIDGIMKFAKSRGCSNIVAFTKNKRVLQIARQAGFKHTHFISTEVE